MNRCKICNSTQHSAGHGHPEFWDSAWGGVENIRKAYFAGQLASKPERIGLADWIRIIATDQVTTVNAVCEDGSIMVGQTKYKRDEVELQQRAVCTR